MMGGARSGAVVFAAASAASAAHEVITKTETTLLNVPLSMLLVAIAGTMIGFFLLPAPMAAKVTEHHGREWKRQLAFRLLTALPLIGFVLCYSFVAAWAVQVGVGIVRMVTRLTVDESLIIPVTGLAGVGIRPWLPALLKAVERRAEKVIGGDE